MSLISLREVSKQLGDFRFSQVSLDIVQGEYLVVLGESGAGKTVLLELIMGLHRPDAGTICSDGLDITTLPIRSRPFSLVYQDQALFPHLSVRENIAYPLRAKKRAAAVSLHTRIQQLAEEFDCADLLSRMPGTLSAGQAQRVALARAIAVEPKVLLLDEPLASLDAQAKAPIRAYLRALNRGGQTIVHVTHDYEEAIALAHRVAIVEEGRIAQIGTPEEILHHPISSFAARFIGIKNFFKGRMVSAPQGSDIFVTESVGAPSITVFGHRDAAAGCIIVRSEDILISLQRHESSAQNNFNGRVTDIEPVKDGFDITVDVGILLTAQITVAARAALALGVGAEIWVSFKASAVRFIGE